MERSSFLIVAKEISADKRFCASAKLLLAQLLDHRNRQTGQCNPKQVTLAQELGIGLRTVERRLSELCERGLIEIRRGQHGCGYEIAEILIRQSGGSETAKVAGRNRQSGGSETSYPYMNRTNEPYIREARARRAGAQARFPSQNKNNSNPTLPPRKSVQSEVLAAYYREQQRKAGVS